MRLVFSLAARRDMAEAVAYISFENPRAAMRQRRLVEQSARRLPDFPGLGRAGEDGRRRMQVPSTPFVLIYEARKDAIVILRVWHGARDESASATPQ